MGNIESTETVSQRDYDIMSQIANVSCGMAVVFGARVLTPRTCCFWTNNIWLYALILWVIYAAVKDYWYDPIYVPTNLRGNPTRDFLFKVLGAAFGGVLILLSDYWLPQLCCPVSYTRKASTCVKNTTCVKQCPNPTISACAKPEVSSCVKCKPAKPAKPLSLYAKSSS